MFLLLSVSLVYLLERHSFNSVSNELPYVRVLSFGSISKQVLPQKSDSRIFLCTKLTMLSWETILRYYKEQRKGIDLSHHIMRLGYFVL